MGMEHFHPRLSQPLRIQSRPRYWNLLKICLSKVQCLLNLVSIFARTSHSKNQKKNLQAQKNRRAKVKWKLTKNEANKAMEPVTKTISKQFMSRVSCQEDMNGVKIKIQFHGHKFMAENLDVQVINDDILLVKAEDDEKKFEKKFKLSSNVVFDKIESKFDIKEENMQTLDINIPKDVKKFQVPISMEE